MFAILCFLSEFIFIGFLSAGEKVMPVRDLSHCGKIQGVVTFCGQNAPVGTKIYIPGKSFFVKTGASGTYELLWIPAATYNLVVEIPGQASFSVNNIVVKKKRITEYDIDVCVDNDGDGFTAFDDCNDNNPGINPGAVELCDGIDNNCDGSVDEGCQTCTDADGDGFFAQLGCNTLVDCDDNEATINPSSPESCNDNIDNNCDGNVDEGCPIDIDQDGYGDDVDCDDNNPEVNPGMPELCNGIDDDCDDEVDEVENIYGEQGVCAGAAYKQCVDGEWSDWIYPETYESTEVSCDGLDNDCDGEVDEGCSLTSISLTGTGSITIPSGVTEITVELWGGGGGGGGSSFLFVNSGGGGGGSGGYSTQSFTVTSGQEYSYIIGIAGIGGLNGESGNSGDPGTKGGNSSFSGPSINLSAGGGFGGESSGGEGGAGGFGSYSNGNDGSPGLDSSGGVGGSKINSIMDDGFGGGNGGNGGFDSSNGMVGTVGAGRIHWQSVSE